MRASGGGRAARSATTTRRRFALVGAALGVAVVLCLLVGISYSRLAPISWPGNRASQLVQRPVSSAVVATMTFEPGRRLDVWSPLRRPRAAPVIVMVHSCCGDRADLGKLAEATAAAGAIVFNADWAGIRPGSRFPQAYDDIGCALAFAQVQAAQFGGDPERLALLGWGDGAMAAAVVAANPHDYLPATCTVRSPAAKPRALVGVAGFYGWPMPVPAQYANPRSNAFFGGNPRHAPRAWRVASPYTALTHAAACTTLLVGRTDPLLADASRYARALRRAHHRVRLVVAPNAGDQSMISPRSQEGRTTVREAIAATLCTAAP